MRIAVMSQLRPGSHRAHAINVVKTAGGFLRLGHDVCLFSLPPEPGQTIAGALADYAEPSLTIQTCPEHLTTDAERAGRWIASAVRDWNPDAAYARDFWSPMLTAAMGIPTVMETHAYVGDTNPLLRRALESTRHQPGIAAVATISDTLAAHYTTLGADPAKLRIIPDGVDLDLFTHNPGAPSPFRTPSPNVVYAGHLYDHKGIPTVLAAARLRPNIHVHLVGGLPADIQRARDASADLPNVTLHGHVPHASVPPYLWHADALLLPPSAGEPSKDWTSPVKLGEYLAAGAPIVASRIPALRAWIDASVCTWFTPDDPTDLARAIDEAVHESRDRAFSRRQEAATLARRFSYASRAAALLDAVFLAAADPLPMRRAA